MTSFVVSEDGELVAIGATSAGHYYESRSIQLTVERDQTHLLEESSVGSMAIISPFTIIIICLLLLFF